jgi:hypothetical protein
MHEYRGSQRCLDWVLVVQKRCPQDRGRSAAGAALIAPGSRRGETPRPEIYVCIAAIKRPGPMMFMTRVRL